MKKKAFTLIELIAVLVILAILALIVTPLVMNIIRKARVSADKRSIDAYGRSIELAIAGYLLDTGTFPTSIGELTVEYKGDEVVCSTTQLNGDSSVYLAGCTVGGRSVGDYAYGTDKTPTYTAYTVGDQVTYNNVDYRVIKDSNASEESVTLLKAEPLSVTEVNTYGGVGTANNHVNMYATYVANSDYYQKGRDVNGYGVMSYYSSETCGYNGFAECTTDYAQSDVKYVVDAWKIAQAPLANEARLITSDELTNNLGYEYYEPNPTSKSYRPTSTTPNWIYNSNYSFWTMSPYTDSAYEVSVVNTDGSINYDCVGSNHNPDYLNAVRPVITISKSALSA